MTRFRAGTIRSALASLILGFSAISGAQAADAGRGKLLYETRCTACHESSVFNRSARKAKSFQGLRAQVLRWSKQTGGAWSVEEIDSVTLYLNELYYRYPCPQTTCKADQASLQTPLKY